MYSELLKQIEKAPRVNLGSVAKRVTRINDLLSYGLDDVRGVSNTKEIVPTKANVTERALERFYVVYPGEFVFNRRVHGTGARRLGLGFNCTSRNFIFTEDYVAFSVYEDRLLPEFLFIFFRRDDFNRYVVTNSCGSATEFFNWEDMCRVKIPLPPIEVQRAYVDAYKGLTALIEENEALLKSLEATAQACVVECREKWPMVPLGKYIEAIDVRNSDLKIKLSQGINNQKYFQNPKQISKNAKSDKVVCNGQFAYTRATTRNGEKISIALRIGETCTVSSAYQVFRVVNEKLLLSEFLLLWFKRPEFDRYARYMSKGSAHEFFEFDDMCRVKIPLPPIEVQRAVVALYHCAEEARRIAAEARQQLTQVCPAMIQRASHCR